MVNKGQYGKVKKNGKKEYTRTKNSQKWSKMVTNCQKKSTTVPIGQQRSIWSKTVNMFVFLTGKKRVENGHKMF